MRGVRSLYQINLISAAYPEEGIKEVLSRMSENVKNNFETEESFEELVEQSLKPLHRGDKVKGVITSIAGNEIYIDLGVKYAGILHVSEISDDPSYKLDDSFKVGDEIEAVVLKVRDADGVVLLSKKLLDAENGWKTIEDALENHSVLEGFVSEENRGGIIVTVLGVKVFVPLSQTGLPKETPVSSIMKKKVKLFITEIKNSRRKVIGSIKAVYAKEKKEAADKVWETIEEGKRYKGIVRSMTSYGAFVDIGGTDGMIHVSELSWNHITKPSDVLSVGQEIDVYVISFDKDKKKISLGYRLEEDNPWTRFEKEYSVGMIVPVKICRFMPFGAFAEIIEGVDGLIHISQVSDHRVAKIDEAIKIGQVVDAKIIGIDSENKRISLSIREVIEASKAEKSVRAAIDAE